MSPCTPHMIDTGMSQQTGEGSSYAKAWIPNNELIHMLNSKILFLPVSFALELILFIIIISSIAIIIIIIIIVDIITFW